MRSLFAFLTTAAILSACSEPAEETSLPDTAPSVTGTVVAVVDTIVVDALEAAASTEPFQQAVEVALVQTKRYRRG